MFYERSAANRHYYQRISYRVQKLKVTKLVDTESQTTVDVYCSTTREGSDTDLCEQIARRNAGDLQSLAADKGHDKQASCESPRNLGIRPLTKRRVFAPYNHAHDTQINKERYNQGSMTEAVNSAVKRSLVAVRGRLLQAGGRDALTERRAVHHRSSAARGMVNHVPPAHHPPRLDDTRRVSPIRVRLVGERLFPADVSPICQGSPLRSRVPCSL
jgi:IS5 family transposase